MRPIDRAYQLGYYEGLVTGFVAGLFASALFAAVAHAAPCPEGCIAASPTRAPSHTAAPKATATARRTATLTSTRRPTTTRTTTRTRIPTRTPTTRATPRATQTARQTATLASQEQPSTYLTTHDQPAGGPARNSYRPDLQLDHLNLRERAHWKPKRGDALARIQIVHHEAGERLWILHGMSGLYDSWRRIGRADHRPAVMGLLLNLDANELANGGFTSSVAATYEGGGAAFWPHGTLRSYIVGQFLDGGISTATISGTNGDRLAMGMPNRYSEQVGATVASRQLNRVCRLQRRAWHGGTRPEVSCNDLDGSNPLSLWRGRAWTTTTTGETEDGLQNGGIAIAEQTDRVVATLNRRQIADTPSNGLYSWPIRGTGTRCVVEGGTWSAPAVAPDGRTAYAIREGVNLVELDTATCQTRERPLVTGVTNSQWPSPPIVTNARVIVIEPSLSPTDDHRATGDLQAYDRTTLEPVWRYRAGILSHVESLSGWSRTDAHYLQCDRVHCYVAGHDALVAVRHDQGLFAGVIFSHPEAPEGFLNPQLYDSGIVVQNTWRQFQFAECEREICPDGKPMSSVDYARCCAGVTPLCSSVDCEQCERQLGWCAHHPERRRMLWPSDAAWVLEVNTGHTLDTPPTH